MKKRVVKNHGALTHGFCKGKSHPTSLLEFFKHTDRQKDKVKPAELIWLFKKPFDRFPHQKLLENRSHRQILECCCCCSVAQWCLTLCHPMDCSIPGFLVLHHLLEFCSNSFSLSWWCHPTISSSVVPFSSVFNLSQHQDLFLMSWLFSNELPKFWSFSFSISPFNEYSGLIFYRTDWIDLLAVQRTLRSLLQHHSSKATLLQRWVFFMVQLSHPYMTTGKTIALTWQTFVGKVISLLLLVLF